MNRFFGLMPSEEVEIEKHYRDDNNGLVIIQAGPHGWSLIYPDDSSNFKDIDAPASENFQMAYDLAIKKIGNLRYEVNNK